MVARLNQYKYLILAFIAAMALIIAAGFIFAEEKSELVYLSKIDKLMFDSNNKAPKFILTLPDYKSSKSGEGKMAEEKKEPEIHDTPQPMPTLAPRIEKKELTMMDILSNVPSLNSLKPVPPTQTLRYLANNDSLVEKKDKLDLPRISNSGKKPWFEYGKVVKVQPNFKRVAIVIKGMGFDDFSLDQISKGMPSEIALSFTPYAQDIDKKIIRARQEGHETYMDLLLSSKDFLKSDSGPMSMSLTISEEESMLRLQKLIAPGAPVGGVVINDGIADESNKTVLENILKELKNRGLLVADAVNGNGIAQIDEKGLARKKADVVIENTLNRKKIKTLIEKAENIALEKGQVLLVIENKPVIVMEVNQWINTFSPQLNYEEAKNMEIKLPLALVPVSNLVVE